MNDADKEEVAFEHNYIKIRRFIQKRDRICSRFELRMGQDKLDGVCYVTDLMEASAWYYDYPQPPTIKALGAEGDDLRILGIKQGHVNINLPAMMTLEQSQEDISFECNGTTYYFKKKRVEELDQYMLETHRYGAVVTGIILSEQGFNSKGDSFSEKQGAAAFCLAF